MGLAKIAVISGRFLNLMVTVVAGGVRCEYVGFEQAIKKGHMPL